MKGLSFLTKGFWSLLVLGAGGGGSGYGISTVFSGENIQKTINKVTGVSGGAEKTDTTSPKLTSGSEKASSAPKVDLLNESTLTPSTSLVSENLEIFPKKDPTTAPQSSLENSSSALPKKEKETQKQPELTQKLSKPSTSASTTSAEKRTEEEKNKPFIPQFEVGKLRCFDSYLGGSVCTRIYHS
ncbi:hypothetical protein MSUIS_06980 [Mycoplasma suis KI3806]|uniref:Uncharacterized protein n=1 Tax=Mycoplasma suis (strain KI_3806) TaxID=708248 RepID=F0V2B0_MYCS3|nr:hypothetical protein [Mycoplasma suis]CBZ40791.1 hypothetical protein MSUIS_06980 [Mycoplasma suis KI3806]